MQVSAMHSKARQVFNILLSTLLLCPILSLGADAEESPPGEKAATSVIYELKMKPKLTHEEKELMRWTDIDGNDIALYSFDAASMHHNEKDADEIIMLVKAAYNNKPLMEKLKEQYADKLKDNHRVPAYSIMELHIRMKENLYAITSISIYDQTHDLVSEATREPVYKKIPNNSFVQTMYRIGEKFVDYQKSFGKKKDGKAGSRQSAVVS